ncbi:MAG: DUF4178 domain-containing protein [Gemmatimonadetes bacterium]|nr:DUF4178 domain-containing protein [Gemmatimonadota bacterium]
MVSFKKLWRREKEPEIDPLVDYTLDKMRIGFFVDYDLLTWEVTAMTSFDYDGQETNEWQISSGDRVRFLERASEDGKVEWTLTRRISLRDVDGDVAGTILDEGEPPEQVRFEEGEYAAVESGSGTMVENAGPSGASQAREFVSWSYESEAGRVLYVVQSGDRDFSAYEGEYVEEYQFTNILPAG